MSRVLVTGASGLLGLATALDLAADHDVTGLSHTRQVVHPRIRSVAADLTDRGLLRQVWADVRPEIVVHTAAMASIEACETDPARAARVNAELVGDVAALCREFGSRLVHISTDAVFDGAAGPYREEDDASPLSVYGETKLEGERRCAEELPSALVARVNFFGWSAVGDRSLAEFFHGALAAGRPVGGFVDVDFSPLYQRDLTDLLLEAVSAGIGGVRHVGGGTSLSKYDFGRELADVFGFDPELVRPASVADLPAGRVRSHRLTLDSSRLARELGHRPPSAREGLVRMRHDRDTGRPDDLRRAVAATSPSTLRVER